MTASLADYAARPGVWNELLMPNGAPRPAWSSLLASPELADSAALLETSRQAERLIREMGITYSVYGDRRGAERPWLFDPVPLLVGAAEWEALEAGLRQRARLLNRVLADLYGPRTLLKQGVLPPAIAFANPAFLRPCDGIAVPRDIWLNFLAVDLVRLADGRWRVLGDRTQAPSGMGYALANRQVSTRVLPSALRGAGVRRLQGFLDTVRRGLAELSRSAEPRIALLTPGPYNETYFEHAYLARAIGCDLVRGEDLMVRDGRLFLNTLSGPRLIDVVLRRLDDGFADPLELRPESLLGVAGLVEAARSGGVVIANALGSGAVETPALAGFMPALARQLLGEELKIEPVESLWPLDPGSAALQRRLPELVLRPGFVPAAAEPVAGMDLSADARAALLAQLVRQPHALVAQAQVAPSEVPIAVDGRLQPRAVVLRAFVAARGPDDYVVMPGGLTRFAVDARLLEVSMQRGGGAKDTWIIDPGPGGEQLGRAEVTPLAIRRSAGPLPSRVADSLYWLGRYAERVESLARLARAASLRLIEAGEWASAPVLEPALLAMRQAGIPAPADEQPARLLDLLMAEAPTALLSEVDLLHRSAGNLRDRLAPDAWRVLSLVLDSGRRPPAAPGELVAWLDGLLMRLAAFAGLQAENTTHGAAWRICDTGRRIERGAHSARFLRTALSGVVGEALLDLAVEVMDSALTYRWRYLAGLQLAPVIDLLVADPQNPRSLAAQLGTVSRHRLAGERPPDHTLSPIDRLIEINLARLRLVDANAWAVPMPDGRHPRLDTELGQIESDLYGLSELLIADFYRSA